MTAKRMVRLMACQLFNYQLPTTNYRLIRILIPGLALLGCAAELVVLAVRAPRIRIEPGRARVRLHLTVGAERLIPVLGWLLPAARAEADERRRLRVV